MSTVLRELMRGLYDKSSRRHKIWLVAGITDMRNGFNGLAAKVQTALKMTRCPATSSSSGPQRQSGQTAVVHRRRTVPADQRLERGCFARPSARDGKVFLTPAQLAMLMEGIDWRQPKRLLTSLTML